MVVQRQTKDRQLVAFPALIDGGTKTNKRPPVGGIPAYDGVIGKRKDKAVRQVLSTKTSKRKRERRTSLCIVHKCAVPKLSSRSKLIAYISPISVNPTVWTVWVTMLFFRNIWPKLT